MVARIFSAADRKGRPYGFKAIPHNAARADSEKNRVLMMALIEQEYFVYCKKK